jgi:hypothetical protein
MVMVSLCRAACLGLAGYTRYPAAASAFTHGPRSVSITITTCTGSGSASSPRQDATSSWNRAIPSAPSGSRRRARVFPASSCATTS